MKIKTDRIFPRGYAKIVAFDPGGTIGVASGTLVQFEDKTWDITFEFDNVSYPDQLYRISEIIEGADVIIIENWNLFPGKKLKKGWRLGPEALGYIYGLVHIKGMSDLVVFQEPGVQDVPYRRYVRKNTKEDWPTGQDHCQSALCHLIYWLEKREK